MAANFHPNLSDPIVQKYLPFFDFKRKTGLCGYDGLFMQFACTDCPFGLGPSICNLNYEYNPHLHLFVEQCKLAHPELFI